MRKNTLNDFAPAVICIVERSYNEKGYESTKTIKRLEGVRNEFRVGADEVPPGFRKYEVRGTDWSECDTPEELLSLCAQHRDALRNHLTDEEYDRLTAAVRADEDGCCDEFYDLHTELNHALDDDGAPRIEGFCETMGRGVLVNFWCTVLLKEDIDDLRREFGIPDDAEIDVETGFGEEDSEVWKAFVKEFENLNQKTA